MFVRPRKILALAIVLVVVLLSATLVGILQSTPTGSVRPDANVLAPPATRSQVASPLAVAAPEAGQDTWPMYMATIDRSSTNTNDTAISAASAGSLALNWSFTAGGPLLASPEISNGLVYVSAGNGDEYALNASTGTEVWATFLGTTATPLCSDDYPHGVTSAPDIVGDTLYVGGGNSSWYALDALTGQILWNITVGNNSEYGGNYNWASGVVYRGNLYIGTASLCDSPLIAARLLQVNVTTHEIVHQFDTSNSTDTGASIWGSPTVDPSTDTVFFATGNGGKYGGSVMAVNASNVSELRGYWQVTGKASDDIEFGNTPILAETGNGEQIVTVSNKNGILYTFDAADLDQGPIWTDRIAVGGGSPLKGVAPISPAVYDGQYIFSGAGNTTIAGVTVKGSVRAINPTTGDFVWQKGLSGIVLGALTYENGAVLADAGKSLVILNASTGTTLYSFTGDGGIYSQATVADGRVYFDTEDAVLYSLAPANRVHVTSFEATPSSVAVDSATIFTVDAAGGTTPYTYSYQHLPGPCTSQNVASLTCTPTSSGTYTVEVEVKDSSGNSAFANATLTVTPSSGAQDYRVNFQQSGLPSGTGWSVTFGGMKHSGHTVALKFMVPNGTYAFEIAGVDGENPSPSSGSVTVDGATVTVLVTFATSSERALNGDGIAFPLSAPYFARQEALAPPAR